MRTSSSYSGKFLGVWLVLTIAGGLLGAAINWRVQGDFVVGLALGVVLGSTLAIAGYLIRSRVPLTPPLPPLNARLLHWILGLTTLGALLYLLAGWVGVPFNLFFPWDGLALLAVCALTEWLLRRGHSFWAASCFIGYFFLPIAFNAQFYGMSSPVNALYLLGILVSGLVLGTNGFFGALAAISILTALFAINEQADRGATVYPVGTPIQSVGLVLFWWGIYGAGVWLSWLFARTLERALQIARGQTAALTQTLNALARHPRLADIEGEVLKTLTEQLDVKWASLFLHNPATNRLYVHTAYGDQKILASERLALSVPPPIMANTSPIWQELTQTRQPILVDDTSNDPRLINRARILADGIQSIFYVPLVLGEEVLGFFSLNSAERRRYALEETELAQALAQQVTLAVQINRLAEQGKQASVLDERNRMARELHDTLAQGFTGIVVQLEAAEDALGDSPDEAAQHLRRARALARESLAEARRSVYALRPQALEHKRLPEALRDSARALTVDAPLTVHLNVDDSLPSLPAQTEAELLRLAQESITNVLKHAQAQTLAISLTHQDDALTLSIADNGRGFDPTSPSSGLGLLGMRERAARLSGELNIESQLGKGTKVTCRLSLAVLG